MTAPGLIGDSARAAADAWLHELAEQRRLSEHTVSAYRRDVALLLELAGPLALESLADLHIRSFVGRLHGRGLESRSLGRVLSAWRGFFHWLGRHRGLKANPVQAVKPPKAKKPLPAALSPDQVQNLLDGEAEDGLELRDKAMFELFYSSGLRLAELASLDLNGGLDLKEGEVTVVGKRQKTRLVPLGAAARQAIEAWLPVRASLASSDEPALFVSRAGRRLTVRSIQLRLGRWAQKQGLGVHVHPHMLRHSFASHVLQSSGDLRAVQEMLGHASITSTQVYTHLDFQHLAQVYDAAHPRAKKS